MTSFDFKKFSLTDENTPMKIGVDSVILGAWAQGENPKKALDIGSGCGLLTFMLVQRYEDIQITGVEIFEPAYDDAVENLKSFYNGKNIRFFNTDIKKWDSHIPYDLIISNPPFFNSSLKPKDKGRAIARFQEELNLQDLTEVVANLLDRQGRFSLIIALSDFDIANKVFIKNHLFLHRKTFILHNPVKKSKRVLLEYRKQKCENVSVSELVIKDIDGSYTDEFIRLTTDFYLAF